MSLNFAIFFSLLLSTYQGANFRICESETGTGQTSIGIHVLVQVKRPANGALNHSDLHVRRRFDGRAATSHWKDQNKEIAKDRVRLGLHTHQGARFEDCESKRGRGGD